jgi:hypothetical protein
MDGTIVTTIDGTSRKFVGKDITVPIMRPGVIGNGAAEEFICTNCTLGTTQFAPTSVRVESVNITFAMTGGIITIPKGSNVTGASNNGSGQVRLQVASTIGMISGKNMRVQNVGGVINGIIDTQIIVIDGTHIDLPGVNFSGSYTGGGLVHNVNPQRWAIPGAHLVWTGEQASETGFHITDVTEGDGVIYVHTNLTGGFPPVDLYQGSLFMSVLASPKWTCINCSIPLAPGLEEAPAGAPLGSYYKFTYDGAANYPYGPVAFPFIGVAGRVVSLKVSVTKAYTGVGSLTFKPFSDRVTYKGDYSKFIWSPALDARTVGTRTITPSAVTGAQASDWGLSIPESVWVAGGGAPPHYSADITNAACAPACWPSITVEIITDALTTVP